MHWVRRLLTDTEDDGRFRAGLGVVMGVCIATLPLWFGMMDARTFLIATLIGAISVAPLWRYVGEPLSKPLSIIAFMTLLIAMVIVLRQLPGLAYFTFLGAWTFTLGLLRFVNGWRNPVPSVADPELEPGPVQPLLVLALVLPLLALVGVIVLGIAAERGMLR